MELIKMLPQEDKANLDSYIRAYSSDCHVADIDHFLRFWNTAKVPFYEAFGDKFILEKEIKFKRDNSDLEDDLREAIKNNPTALEFFNNYEDVIRHLFYNDWDMRYNLLSFVDNITILSSNSYYGDTIIIPAELTKNNKPLKVEKGCKAMKMLGKIAKALDCDKGYEEFRLAHSLALNQKEIIGTLCLSIHPLDYVTMSDNDCDWDSCMTWTGDNGDYRVGTIEMMNSPSVVVAYIKEKRDMKLENFSWNSKRWRQLFIVTDKVILGNKQYPYFSDDIQGYAIKWLRELVSKNPGWGPYSETVYNIRNFATNTIGTKLVTFNFCTKFMYNDVYDLRMAYVAENRFEDDETYNHTFSGPAVCTCCGNEITSDIFAEANLTICGCCRGGWKCDCCGDWHEEYDESYTVDDDYTYCDYCYHHETSNCEICEETTAHPNQYYITIESEYSQLKNQFNGVCCVELCSHCSNPEIYEPYFGPVTLKTINEWMEPKLTFNLKNITDEGLKLGCLSNRQIQYLKLMRDAGNDGERLSPLERYSY